MYARVIGLSDGTTLLNSLASACKFTRDDKIKMSGVFLAKILKKTNSNMIDFDKMPYLFSTLCRILLFQTQRGPAQ